MKTAHDAAMLAHYRQVDRMFQATTVVVVTLTHVLGNVGVLMPWLTMSSSGIAIFVSFNALAAMMYVSYYKACTTSPGYVPAGWAPPPGSAKVDEDDALEEKADAHVPSNRMVRDVAPPPKHKSSRYVRFCKRCTAYKPMRAHHCSRCNRCVLKMDHHCPYIANCVGHGNQAHFFRFLFFVVATCAYGLILLLVRMSEISEVHAGSSRPPALQVISLALDTFVVIPTLFLVGYLMYIIGYYILVNSTTIEAIEIKSNNGLRLSHNPFSRTNARANPFYMGVYKNVCSILGPDPALWLMPVSTPGDGLTYPVNSFFQVAPGEEEGEVLFEAIPGQK